MESESLQPTVDYQPTAMPAATGASGLDDSKAQIGFVDGDRPKFADETANLLRRRLTAATLVVTVVLAVAFLGNVVGGVTSLWWLRASILLALCGCLAALRSDRFVALRRLRFIEFLTFGSVVVQLSLMLVTRLAEFAARNEAPSAVAVQQQFLGAWCVLILAYGIFMPNTWKRGALVMLPIAVVPYVVLAVQRWLSPGVAVVLDADRASAPIPLPLVAALVGTYGTYIINSARREAFKARQFGQYRLLERLGGGGMGVVYKAEHVLLKRPCAIKLIKPESEADATALAHFEKEVKATARLSHWNTVEIYDYGHTDDGTFYYVMELLPGMSLVDLVEKHGPLPPERVIHVLRQVCGALQEAHAVGLIHRDIKPANIFAAQRGGVFDVAKLLDFGLVKERVEKPADGERPAGQGAFSGTPLYMSPEQGSAYEDVDARADIYSLGAVAYYLLTGTPPFSGKNVLELLAAHGHTEVVPPSRINSAVPSDLEQVLLRCLAKNATDRYQDAGSLELALAQCQCAHQWTAERAAQWWASEQAARQAASRGVPNAEEGTVAYSSPDN